MTKKSSYSVAMFPARHRVRGRWMVPYTIGHSMLLENLQSPFVTTTKRLPTRWDVKLFGSLCSRTYPQARDLTQSKWLTWRLLFFRCSDSKLIKAIHEIIGYLMASNRRPARWEKEGGRTLGTPLLQQLKLTLMMNVGKSEMEALCTPVSLAFHDCYSIWEMDGGPQLAEEIDHEGDEDLLNRIRASKLSPDMIAAMEKTVAKFKEQAEREDEFGA